MCLMLSDNFVHPTKTIVFNELKKKLLGLVQIGISPAYFPGHEISVPPPAPLHRTIPQNGRGCRKNIEKSIKGFYVIQYESRVQVKFAIRVSV